jgi:hypothetical protein
VGHAYRGAVIAGPNGSRLPSLVYISALAPAKGETVADVFYRAKPHPRAPNLQPEAHELIWMPEGAFANAVKASPDQTALCILIGCICGDRNRHPLRPQARLRSSRPASASA